MNNPTNDENVLVIEPKPPTHPTVIIAKPIATLVTQFVTALTEPKPASTPIHVDEIASRVAKFYELIRKVVDWKEDNLLRRNAIERFLKRLLFSRLSGLTLVGHINANQIAETITLDLIRGGHLPNDEIAREKIATIAQALTKYLYLYEHTSLAGPDPLMVKQRINYFTFLIELAACEIEEIVVDRTLSDGLLHAMHQSMLSRIQIKPPSAMSDDEKYIQTYIAVYRSLFNLDDAFISYRLLTFQYPEWRSSTPSFMEQMNRMLPDIWEQLPSIINHPLAKQFYAYSDRYDAVFTLIGDVLDAQRDNPGGLSEFVEDKERFSKDIESFYDKRYATLKKRLFTLGAFSTLSVFASNWATFYFVEVPLANIFAEGFSLFTAFIDFLVPTAVMFALVSIIRPPKAVNKKRVLDAIGHFVYGDGKVQYFDVRVKQPHRPIASVIITITYTALTIAVLSGIAWVFWVARLPITSVIFDTFTIALTVFAAVTIRNKSKELSVGDRASISEFFLDMLSVPIAKLGSLLASKWKEYNIIAFVFTFLIETPFVAAVGLIEQWSQFLKDKRDELR